MSLEERIKNDTRAWKTETTPTRTVVSNEQVGFCFEVLLKDGQPVITDQQTQLGPLCRSIVCQVALEAMQGALQVA